MAEGVGIVQSEHHTLRVRLPRGQVTVAAEQATPAVVDRFPGTNHLTVVSVRLAEGAQVRVDGFGMPFKNPQDSEVEGWVNHNTPIIHGMTLVDFLRRREYHFVVPMSTINLAKEWGDDVLLPPFSYPYGTEHHWHEDGMDQYTKLLEETKSAEPFRPAYG